MKRVLSCDDIPYELNFDPESGSGNGVAVWVSAPVVGTDGLARAEKHTTWLGTLKVRKRGTGMVFGPKMVIRAGGSVGLDGRLREIPVPRNPDGPGAVQSLRAISDRMEFLLSPQTPGLFRGKPTKELCKRINDYVDVRKVIGS